MSKVFQWEICYEAIFLRFPITVSKYLFLEAVSALNFVIFRKFLHFLKSSVLSHSGVNNLQFWTKYFGIFQKHSNVLNHYE